MTAPTVTLSVCTWNRARRLDRTLAALRELRVPPGVTWEVQVVDNHSSDDTPAVLAKHADGLPLKPLFEPRPGIAFARNAAVRNAAGEYLLWTDDDALPEPNWLEATLDAFQRFAADLVFGPVRPHWEGGEPPAWYTPAFDGMFALLDLGGDARLTADPLVTGFNVNLGFRRSLPDKLGLYREDLGTGRMGGAEDLDLFRRAHAAGLRVAYQPAAVVHHVIPASRCTKRFYRRYTWGGSTHALKILRDQAGNAPRLFGLPRYYYRQQVGHLKDYLSAVLRGDRGRAFLHELKLIRLAGLLWNAAAGRTHMATHQRAGE